METPRGGMDWNVVVVSGAGPMEDGTIDRGRKRKRNADPLERPSCEIQGSALGMKSKRGRGEGPGLVVCGWGWGCGCGDDVVGLVVTRDDAGWVCGPGLGLGRSRGRGRLIAEAMGGAIVGDKNKNRHGARGSGFGTSDRLRKLCPNGLVIPRGR